MNNMLKAITASLLMEQVVAPNFKFKTKRDPTTTGRPASCYPRLQGAVYGSGTQHRRVRPQ